MICAYGRPWALFMRSFFVCTFLFLTLGASVNCQARCTYYPPDGFVPDAATAVRIAKAVSIPLFGLRSVNAKRFKATLSKGIWTIYGTPTDGVGEVAEIEISKKSGAILDTRLAHMLPS